jgi:hypothetical protein
VFAFVFHLHLGLGLGLGLGLSLGLGLGLSLGLGLGLGLGLEQERTANATGGGLGGSSCRQTTIQHVGCALVPIVCLPSSLYDPARHTGGPLPRASLAIVRNSFGNLAAGSEILAA